MRHSLILVKNSNCIILFAIAQTHTDSRERSNHPGPPWQFDPLGGSYHSIHNAREKGENISGIIFTFPPIDRGKQSACFRQGILGIITGDFH
jgi:hypothetical protein